MIPALSFIFRSLHLPYKPLELSPRFLFLHYCYFYWDTQRKPLRKRQDGDGGSKWWAPVYFSFFQANRRYQGETLPGELSVLLCTCIAHARQGSGESGINWPVKRTPVDLPIRPGLLEAWLVLTSVKYHGNLYNLIPLNQRLTLTRLRATGPRIKGNLKRTSGY